MFPTSGPPPRLATASLEMAPPAYTHKHLTVVPRGQSWSPTRGIPQLAPPQTLCWSKQVRDLSFISLVSCLHREVMVTAAPQCPAAGSAGRCPFFPLASRRKPLPVPRVEHSSIDVHIQLRTTHPVSPAGESWAGHPQQAVVLPALMVWGGPCPEVRVITLLSPCCSKARDNQMCVS